MRSKDEIKEERKLSHYSHGRSYLQCGSFEDGGVVKQWQR